MAEYTSILLLTLQLYRLSELYITWENTNYREVWLQGFPYFFYFWIRILCQTISFFWEVLKQCTHSAMFNWIYLHGIQDDVCIVMYGAPAAGTMRWYLSGEYSVSYVFSYFIALVSVSSSTYFCSASFLLCLMTSLWVIRYSSRWHMNEDNTLQNCQECCCKKIFSKPFFPDKIFFFKIFIFWRDLRLVYEIINWERSDCKRMPSLVYRKAL